MVLSVTIATIAGRLRSFLLTFSRKRPRCVHCLSHRSACARTSKSSRSTTTSPSGVPPVSHLLCFSPSQPGCEKYVAKLAAEEDELASLYTSLDDRKKTRTATNKTLAASCAAIRFSKKIA